MKMKYTIFRNDYGCFAIANGCQYEQPLKLGHDILRFFFSDLDLSVCCVDISDAEAHFWQK